MCFLCGTIWMYMLNIQFMSWDSSVGVERGYMLDGPGSIPGGDKFFLLLSTVSRPALGPTQPPIQWVPGLFPQT
jgi:hypothetical protein